MPGYPLPLQLFCFRPLKLVTVANIHHFVRLTHLTVGSLNHQQDWFMRQAIFLHPRYTPGAFQKKYANFEVAVLTYFWASNVKMDVANRSIMFVSWWNNVNFRIIKKSVIIFFAHHHRSKIESGQTNVPCIWTINICFSHCYVLEATIINGYNKEQQNNSV